MNPRQVEQMIKWLNRQIAHSNEYMNEANHTNNYGKETQYQGMRDAFVRCLNKFNSL